MPAARVEFCCIALRSMALHSQTEAHKTCALYSLHAFCVLWVLCSW